VNFVNDAISKAPRGSTLYGLPPITDPSDKIIKVHLAALKWNLLQRRFGLVAEDVAKLHSMSVELLELLKTNLPEKSGQSTGWKFEKAHSILHKAREIILFGWTENFNTQVRKLHCNDYISYIVYDIIYVVCVKGPEHCHIDFLKNLAQCQNNKEVYLCIMRCHMREGHLQYLRQLESDLLERDDDGSGAQGNPALIASRKNEAISCELGIRYPTLQAIMSGKKNIQTTKVNSLIVCKYVRTSYVKSCHISYHM
jgi:hypothetical protein